MFRISSGRVPKMESTATLSDYHRYQVKGYHYPAIYPKDGASVDGIILSGITTEEMAALDKYEGDDYKRVLLKVRESSTGNEREVFGWKYVSDINDLYGAWSYDEYLKTEDQYIQSNFVQRNFVI